MAPPLVGTLNYPTSIRFGAGRIRELPDACKAIGHGLRIPSTPLAEGLRVHVESML